MTGDFATSWDDNFENFKDRFYGSDVQPLDPTQPTSDPIEYEHPFDHTVIPIDRHELNAVFKNIRDSTPGPDKIPLIYIKQVWSTLGPVLQEIYNNCLYYSFHPRQWEFTETSILAKVGKSNYSTAGSFRPIALATFFTRILEKLMTDRLTYHLEKEPLYLHDNPFGFRKNRSSTDGLIKLRQFIESEWKKKKVVSVLALDLTGAYDNVDHNLLLDKMEQMNVPGYIINWTKQFLRNRTTYLRTDHHKSLIYALIRGVPQGSPISPILFTIFSTDLLKTLIYTPGIADTEWTRCDNSGYADDLICIASSSSIKTNLNTFKTKIIPMATEWALKNKQTFSPKKTELIHFTGKTKKPESTEFYDEPLIFDYQLIYPKNSIRLLGIYFDPNLNWKSHIEIKLAIAKQKWHYYKYCCRKLGKLTYNMKRTIFKGIIEPTITYGAWVWENISVTNFKPATVQCNTFYRNICGAIRNSCALSATHESGILPIKLRCQEIAMNQAHNHHYNYQLHQEIMIYIPPWEKNLSCFKFILKPSKLEAFHNHNRYLDECLPDWVLYTDGSVTGQDEAAQVGAGHHSINQITTTTNSGFFRLHRGATIYDAEEGALIRDLLLGLQDPNWKTGVIFTDSKSVAQHWNHIQSDNLPFCPRILHNINQQLTLHHRSITIVWIPSHQGIPGNEIADRLAAKGAQA